MDHDPKRLKPIRAPPPHPQPSAPQWDKDNKNVFLEYEHGSAPCHGNLERKTRIDLYCPGDASEVRQRQDKKEKRPPRAGLTRCLTPLPPAPRVPFSTPRRAT